MFYKNNITDNEDGLSAPMLTEAVETIAACSNDLMVVAEAITQSCNLVENLDEAHKDVLVTRAEALKRLASLYKSRSIRFKAVAQKLVEGAIGDDTLPANGFC
jgi:hypothetical protein